MPFHHLSTQGFWRPLTKDLQTSAHRSLTEVVAIEPSFLAAISDAAFRKAARAVLVNNYFPPLEQLALSEERDIQTENLAEQVNEDVFGLGALGGAFHALGCLNLRGLPAEF